MALEEFATVPQEGAALEAGAAAAAVCLSPEQAQQRTVIHAATGHLVARLAGCGLDDAAVKRWAAACARRVIAHVDEGGEPIRQADLDLSHNAMTDAGLRSVLRAWSKTQLACPLILKAHFNRLTDTSLAALAVFVQSYRGQLRELHLSNNSFHECEAVLALWRSFAGLPQYPMWVRRQRRYAPVYLRLGACGVAEPESLLRIAEEGSLRLCLMEEGCCSKTLCGQTGRGGSSTCPLLHVYGFLDQSRKPVAASHAHQLLSPGGAADAAEAARGGSGSAASHCSGAGSGGDNASSITGSAPSSSSSRPISTPQAAPGCTPTGTCKVATFLCGACGRDLPVDMFGRHQFRKAAAVDALPTAGKGGDTGAAAAPGHLVRRCNDCVDQPCSACGAELPLSQFAKSQMMRPRGQRRCRACTADTQLCVRCGRPRPRAEFSPAQAQKSKALPRVCTSCEHVNPYFERRYAVAAALGHSRVGGRTRAGLPRLPQETIQRIVALSEPGDEFTSVRSHDFHCSLCSRSWSLLTNEVERHVRHSEVHRRRSQRLQDGLLVRIADLEGLEVSRFRNGLGIQGPVCSRERVEEARALVPLETAIAQGVAMESLRVAGVAEDCSWVPPRTLQAALQLQLSSGHVPAEVEARPSSAEVRSARRRWKLFGHHLGAQAEAGDSEELSALCAMLSAG